MKPPVTKEAQQWATRFLFDYEATKKHLFETEFLAPFAERAHKLGLLVAGEPYGDGDFDMETFVKYLDLPMSEYWAKSHGYLTQRSREAESAENDLGLQLTAKSALIDFHSAGLLRGFACHRIPGYSATVINSDFQQPCASAALRTE